MYTITINRNSGKYELVRNRDGRVMADAPFHDSIFYAMAFSMAEKQAHLSGHLWRAAEEAAAGLVELTSNQDHHQEWDGWSWQIATVNGYQIRRWQREAEAVAAPMPKPVYTCTCDYYEKANGKRPLLAEMPVCKHILAGMMWRQWEIAPERWTAEQAQRQRGRDTFGLIQKAEAEQPRPRTKEYDEAHPVAWTDSQLDELAARTPGNISRANRKKANRPRRPRVISGYVPNTDPNQPF